MSSQRSAMHAGEAVAEALREEGVERVYSVPGSHIHPIYDGLSRVSSIRMVTCKQEPNVSLMADAYGQTFMQQSNLYGHTYGTSFHSPDYAGIASSCGAKGIRVTDPKDVEGALRHGLAATKKRPVLVEVMVARHPYPKI